MKRIQKDTGKTGVLFFRCPRMSADKTVELKPSGEQQTRREWSAILMG